MFLFLSVFTKSFQSLSKCIFCAQSYKNMHYPVLCKKAADSATDAIYLLFNILIKNKSPENAKSFRDFPYKHF